MHAPRRPATPRRRTTAAPRSVRSSPLRQNPQLSVQRARSEEASASVRASGSRLILWSGLIAIVAISIGYLARRAPMALPAAPPASRVAAAPPAAAPAAGVELSRAAPAEPASAAPASSVSALRASPPSADDDTSSGDSSDSSARSSEATPGSSRGSGGNSNTDEFGQGRLHLPVIYRLRMDDAGGTLRGERTPTGFEITIPGRRMLDSGASITRRDPRIAKVTTHNSAQGARVSFRFRETIPAYKVRIRKDIVEFWISAN
jgi:hypothetical protein